MRTLKYKLLFIACILLILGCGKDEIIVSVEDTVLTNTEDVSFQFLITNKAGHSISNAQILINSESYLTDYYGIVITKPMSVSAEGMRAEIIALGHDPLVKMVTGPSNSTKLEHVMLLKSITSTISTGTTGSIDGEGFLTLPPILNRENGSSYSGEVTVKNKYLDPDNKDFLRYTPGNLLALNNDDEYQQLASLGMYMIELYDNSGGVLTIPEGSLATIKFPIADKHSADIASEIPLWYFDEITGLWIEDGIAKVKDGMMVAEVNHFTWWNCDIPYDFSEICLVFSNIEGNILPGLEVEFSINGVSFGLALTDINGNILAKIPTDETVELTYYVNGVEVGTQTIGPFGENVRKEVVVVNLFIPQISGTAIDCNGNPVSNGYIYYFTPNGVSPNVINNDGTFIYFAPKLEHQLHLIDLNADKSKEVTVLEEDQIDDFDLETIMVCEEEGIAKVSGKVLIDTDRDNVGDTPLPMASISILNTFDNSTEIVKTDENGYYESKLIPGIDYTLNYVFDGSYVLLASGDRIPDGDGGKESFRFGNKDVNVNIGIEENDEFNDFLVTENGEGIISGTFMGDTDNDGIGDLPLEWARMHLIDIYGTNHSNILVGSDGAFSSDKRADYYRLSPSIYMPDFDYILKWDISPDPDGGENESGLNNNPSIPVVLHKGENDADNTFVIDYSGHETFLCRVMEDIDGDGQGDAPVEGINVLINNRETGLSIGGGETNDLGIMNFDIDNFTNLTKITAKINNPEYEVINIVDTSPDGDPFILDGDVTKMVIDIAKGEWDAGNIFIVRKI